METIRFSHSSAWQPMETVSCSHSQLLGNTINREYYFVFDLIFLYLNLNLLFCLFFITAGNKFNWPKILANLLMFLILNGISPIAISNFIAGGKKERKTCLHHIASALTMPSDTSPLTATNSGILLSHTSACTSIRWVPIYWSILACKPLTPIHKMGTYLLKYFSMQTVNSYP